VEGALGGHVIELALLVCGLGPVALGSGTELGEGGEVLGAPGGGRAGDDVLRGRDRDLESVADRLGVGVCLEVFIAAGAVGSAGDVEVAGVGGEVQDLSAGPPTRVGGEGNGAADRRRWGSRRVARARASARRWRWAWSVAAVMSMSRVTTSTPATTAA
jgi:hypothetical protein